MRDKPRICVSITERTPHSAIGVIEKLEPLKPDYIELRLDYLDETLGIGDIRGATGLPLIATNRPRGDKNQRDRISHLLEACEAGYEYIDLDVDTRDLGEILEEVEALGTGIILSYHNHLETPPLEELSRILDKQKLLGADICKIVGTARTQEDNLTYLQFLKLNPNGKIIALGMGQEGGLSRIFSPLFGGFLTYASTEKGSEAAPGQITLAGMREIYRIMGV
jgi:3-dehydroquinate dehydratase type I